MDNVQFSDAEEKILIAALKVVNESTLGGTRMHAIAEKAGMVQSNVHYYYKTKQDLIDGLQERILQEFYTIRRADRKKSQDTLEDQMHIFFNQKKYMITKKKEFDYAEMDFMVQSKINNKIRSRFCDSYSEWRDSIREIIIRYCPEIDDADKEIIPYLIVSLLEGASLQTLVEGKNFDSDSYFESAEKMALSYIETARKKAGN